MIPWLLVASLSTAAVPSAGESRLLLPALRRAVQEAVALLPPPHRHDRWVTVGKYTGTILGVLEMGFSEACIQRGVCSEVNRFMPDGRSNADTAGRMTIKGAGIVALLWIIERLEQLDQKVLARIAAGGFVVVNGWLAVNAYRHLGQARF